MRLNDHMAVDEIEERRKGLSLLCSPKSQININLPPCPTLEIPKSVPVNRTEAFLKGEQDCLQRYIRVCSNTYDQYVVSKISDSTLQRKSTGQESDPQASISALIVASIPCPKLSTLFNPGRTEPDLALDVTRSSNPHGCGLSYRGRSKVGRGRHGKGRRPGIEWRASSPPQEPSVEGRPNLRLTMRNGDLWQARRSDQPSKPNVENKTNLRSDKVEKQFSCRYCARQFDKKGQLSRHEISLHIRPFSWSCAALTRIQDAFHGCTCLSSETHGSPSHDSCGYCGERFPNFPVPEWAPRLEHLKIVHRYDDCTKPVSYRGDNFRLHLRDSHAGILGWWMTPLERACRKEEQRCRPRDEPWSVCRLQGNNPGLP